MKTIGIGVVVGISLLLGAGAWGQKGVGEPIGLAQQGAQPEIESLQGRLERIETGPCRRSTGQAYIGTHLFLRTEEAELINLHVGSAEAVAPFVDSLQEGQWLEADAFRTDLHEPGHYVAKILRTEDAELVVRTEDLSPFWAAQRHGRSLQQQRDRRQGDMLERVRDRDRERPRQGRPERGGGRRHQTPGN